MEARKEQLWRQYIIAGIASLSLISTGYTMGWTSPVNVILDDPEQSPLPDPVTIDQLGWIGSTATFGSVFGGFFGGFLSGIIGRKWALISSAVPFLTGWVLITVAQNVATILAGRAIGGLGVGMTFGILPMYFAEIATVEARGILGSYLQNFMAIGTLLVYVVGPFTTYYGISYVGIGMVVAFVAGFIFMPESPTYYLLKNNKEAAAKSLAMTRGRSIEDVQKELEMISADVEESKNNTKTGKVGDIFRGKNFKAFCIGSILVVFMQFSGIHAVLFYMTEIFTAAGTNISPAYATIIVGGVQLFASGTVLFVVDRLGRRTLLMISSCGTAVGLGLLGTYFLLDEIESPAKESLNFLPLLSLVLFMLMYSWGLGALPFVIIGEIMPIEIKAFSTAFASGLGSACSFLITRFFGPISDAAGHYVMFYVFAGNCIVCCLFAFFVLPETKGKTFNEIQDLLAGSQSKKEVDQVKEVKEVA